MYVQTCAGGLAQSEQPQQELYPQQESGGDPPWTNPNPNPKATAAAIKATAAAITPESLSKSKEQKESKQNYQHQLVVLLGFY